MGATLWSLPAETRPAFNPLLASVPAHIVSLYAWNCARLI
jgi:hypothetical protein